MQIYQNANLAPFHTFSINAKAETLIEVESISDLQHVYQDERWQAQPKLVLGKGSNVLFTTDYQGVVLVNRIRGIEVEEDEHCVRVYARGGEDWPELVEHVVNQGIGGLENLALIPGCVGSSPIQNIGAYGVELKDVCEYIDYFDITTFETIRLHVSECYFGYRDSIFKHELKSRAVIIGVGLKLAKPWTANLSYGPLKSLGEHCSPKEVFDAVCAIRRAKLPDPEQFGNAGSFFKNPVISAQRFTDFHRAFPDAPYYQTDEGIKLAAGWLIEQCGLKGHSIGGAKVHSEQALVLINEDNASAADVIALANHVKSRVADIFMIQLEHEVRFIGSNQETSLEECVTEAENEGL